MSQEVKAATTFEVDAALVNLAPTCLVSEVHENLETWLSVGHNVILNCNAKSDVVPYLDQTSRAVRRSKHTAEQLWWVLSGSKKHDIGSSFSA
jgi:hypothetical protein